MSLRHTLSFLFLKTFYWKLKKLSLPFQFLRKFFLKMKINICPKIHIIISPLCRPSHVWARHINQSTSRDAAPQSTCREMTFSLMALFFKFQQGNNTFTPNLKKKKKRKKRHSTSLRYEEINILSFLFILVIKY